MFFFIVNAVAQNNDIDYQIEKHAVAFVNYSNHAAASEQRKVTNIILTDIACPRPIPDPKFTDGSLAYLDENGNSQYLPGCYIHGPLGVVMVKFANGFGQKIRKYVLDKRNS